MIKLDAIHNDAINDILTEAGFTIVSSERASDVEPEVVNNELQWFADMKRMNGPKLGPFHSRESALEAEHQWLCDNWLGKEV